MMLLAVCPKVMAITTDELEGTYKEEATGRFWTGIWEGFEGVTGTVTISKIDETSVKITGIRNWSGELIGTVNLEAKTITIEPQTLNVYYTFCNGDVTIQLV